MNNMHDDMNGSAVALGILTAATQLKLPVNLDVWLAIAVFMLVVFSVASSLLAKTAAWDQFATFLLR